MKGVVLRVVGQEMRKLSQLVMKVVMKAEVVVMDLSREHLLLVQRIYTRTFLRVTLLNSLGRMVLLL
jgi:hypothetical protein